MHPKDLLPEAAAILKDLSSQLRELVDEGADTTRLTALVDTARYMALYRGSVEPDSVQCLLEIWVPGSARVKVAMTRCYPEGCCRVVPTSLIVHTSQGLAVMG